MTTSIANNLATLATRLPTADTKISNGNASGISTPTPTVVPMDAATVRALTDAVASKLLVGEDSGERRTGPAAIVELRQSTISLQDAGDRLAGIVSKLPLMLSALVGSQDPMKSEEGASARASEAAAAQAPARGSFEGPSAAAAPADAVGVDADIGERSANAGAWIVSSPFSHLLAMLRQLLLKFERMDRDNSAQMVTMQREITIMAGDKGVEKARESLGGAIGAAIMTGAIGGAALKQTFKSTSMQTNSADANGMVGNKVNAGVETSKGGMKGNTTPADELRPAHGLDGKKATAAKGSERPAAEVRADVDADPAMKQIAREQSAGPGVDDVRSDYSEVNARAQIPASNAMMLNMLAPSIGGTVSAGVAIEAEMTEAERQLALQVADVFRRIADEQQDQSVKTREMRDAAAQLFESLLNLTSSTSAHIIGKY